VGKALSKKPSFRLIRQLNQAVFDNLKEKLA